MLPRAKKGSSAPLKGVLQVRDGLHRSAVSNGPIAFLAGEEGLHGSFLAVAASQEAPPRPLVRASSGQTPLSELSPALQLPVGLSLGPVGGGGMGLPQTLPRRREEGHSLLGLQLYSVVVGGGGGDQRESLTTTCLHLHSVPLPFSPPSPRSSDKAAPFDPLVSVVEKIVWAGPRLVAVLNARGKALVCKTGLGYAARDRMESSSSSQDGGEGGEAEEHTSAPTHFERVVDIAAASAVHEASGAVTTMVCVAGLSAIRALVTQDDVPIAAAGGGGRHSKAEPRLLDWAPLGGPFHSVALLPYPHHTANEKAREAHHPAVFLLAGCTSGGAVQVYRWTLSASVGDDRQAESPVVVGQVLMGPRTAFWGLAAGQRGQNCLFAVLGTSASAAPHDEERGAPSIADERRPLTATASFADAPTLTSLRGKNGQRLAVTDFFSQKDGDVNLLSQRALLNEVYAQLRKPADTRAGSSPRAATTLDDIAAAVLVTPPTLAGVVGTRQEVFLLSLSVDTTREARGEEETIEMNWSARCRTRYCSLSAHPGCAAALTGVSNAPLRLAPHLHFHGEAVGSSSSSRTFGFLLHSGATALSFKGILSNDALLTVPVACYSATKANGSDTVLVGADLCHVSSGGASSQLSMLLAEGTKEVAVSPAETQKKEYDASNSATVSHLTLSVTPESMCAFKGEVGVGSTVHHASPVVSSSSSAATDREALRDMIRAVIKEENAELLANMEARMSRLENKLDEFLARLDSSK